MADPYAVNPTSTRLQPVDSMTNITTLLDMISGKSSTETTGPSTSTTHGNLSMDQMTQIIQNILGGSQGLASVAQGQKTAGIYNSTTSQQLVNDLLARVSTNVAAANAGQTTTKSGETKTVQTPGLADKLSSQAALKSLGLGAAAWLLGPTAKALGKKTGISDLPQGLADKVFGPAGYVGAETMDGYADAALKSSQDIVENGMTDSEALQRLMDSDSYSILDAGDETGVPIGSALKMGQQAVSFLEGSSNIGDTIDTGINAGLSYVTGGTSSLVDMATDGAVSHAVDVTTDTISHAGEVFGDAISNATSSIICTESVRQGLLSPELYAKESLILHPQLSVDTINGYHLWAPKIVFLMRKYKWVAKISAAGAEKYLEYRCEDKFSIFGVFAKFIGEPICSILGKIYGAQDWKVVYAE